MSYIKVVKVKESIENLNQYMNIYQAINRLDWILKNKCINCEQQCTDCYLDFESKIAIEKILTYLKVNGSWKEATPYIKINGSWKETS